MGRRAKELRGSTIREKTGCGNLYITLNEGEGVKEVFCTMGKAGGCASAQCEALGRLVSLALNHGASKEEVWKTLAGISCSRGDSCPDALARVLRERGEESDIYEPSYGDRDKLDTLPKFPINCVMLDEGEKPSEGKGITVLEPKTREEFEEVLKKCQEEEEEEEEETARSLVKPHSAKKIREIQEKSRQREVVTGNGR